MSTIHFSNFICGACGKLFGSRVLGSTNAFGSPDLDMRPPQMQRGTMHLWLRECPHCGYVHSDIERDGRQHAAFLKSEAYKSCEGQELAAPLSQRFYKYALIEQREQDYEAAYGAFLHAAWAADDYADHAGAILCRRKALELFDRAFGAENEDRLVQRADLLRRAGMFDRVIAEYADFKSERDLLNEIVAFQIARAKEKDDSVYRVVECKCIFMKLEEEPFELIKSGKKTVEVRCNDEKRQRLRVGDKLIFVKCGCPSEKIFAEITDLRAFKTFEELYSAYPMAVFGYRDGTVREMVRRIDAIYSRDRQEKYGALAITLKAEYRPVLG